MKGKGIRLQNSTPKKKQEILMLIVLGLLLALIILISKFVIGINFSLMENEGYLSIGFHEVHGSQIWALEFESFTGSISYNATLPDDPVRRLLIYSDTYNSDLTLTIGCGDKRSDYILQDKPLDVIIPGDENIFTLTLSGTDVLSGYFDAIWE